VLLSCKEAKVILALVLAYSGCVRDARSAVSGAAPYQVAVVVVYVGAGVEVAVGGDEDVAWGEEVGLEEGGCDYWGVEVGSLYTSEGSVDAVKWQRPNGGLVTRH